MKKIVGWLLVFVSLSAQEPDWEKMVGAEQESDGDHLVSDHLESLQRSPMDLNRASASDLESLPWIAPQVAHAIVAFRNRFGPFHSLQQLTLIKGMDETTLALIAPFVFCKDQRRRASSGGNIRYLWSQPLQQSRGFIEKKYNGSPVKALLRTQIQPLDWLQLGWLMEKDSGERSLNDYRCGYVQVQRSHPGITLLLGHLTAESGQGLVFSHPGKWSDAWDALAAAKRRIKTVRPYLSTDENAGLFGSALQWQSDRLQATLLWSRTPVDASVENDSIRSFIATGLHRSAAERATQSRVKKTAAGAIVRWQPLAGLCLGLCVQQLELNAPAKKQNRPDAFFDFSGRSALAAGLNWDAMIGSVNWFGECARIGDAVAVNSGVWWQMAQWRQVLAVELIPTEYDHLLYPHLSLPEKNRRSLRWAMMWQVLPSLTLSFSALYTLHPWLRYRVEYASTLSERQQIVAVLAASKGLTVTMRCQRAGNPGSETLTADEKIIRNQIRNALLGQIDYQPAKSLNLRSRVEWNLVVRRKTLAALEQNSQAVSLYQQAICSLARSGSLCARLTWFQASEYDNRFFEYEQDLPGRLRIKMLYGRGWRWFLLAGFRYRGLHLTAKYEETIYQDRDHTGSGWDEVSGNRERWGSLQAELRW
ncbi:helix-hairpin-helix domain-containing protein [bacterium]|nr:helix-hairpin-helix domain-containing protein [bacterium]